MDVPHVFDDVRSRDGTVGVVHEEFEQRVFLRLQVDRLPRSRHPATDRIDFEVRDTKLRLPRLASAQQRSNARRQLCQNERFAHVVVGPAVETGNTLFRRRLRTEDQHGQLGLPRSNVAQDLESRPARKHQVEDDAVVIDHLSLHAGIIPVVENIDGEPLFLEALLNEAGHSLIVFDHQYAHGIHGILRPPPTPRWQLLAFDDMPMARP